MNTLQDAYDNGNEINVSLNKPILLKSPNPGAGTVGGHTLPQALKDAVIIASGFATSEPLSPLSIIGPGYMTMRGSGVGGGEFYLETLKAPLIGQATLATANGKMILSALGNQFLLSQGNGESAIDMTGGQITLKPHLGSGQLNYQFGPHESWHTKSLNDPNGGPYGNGLWPIPHSGQIQDMINETVKAAIKAHIDNYHS
jgi:hypothetical protein